MPYNFHAHHPFAAYRSRYQQVGPWQLRLLGSVVLGLCAAAGYWFLLPMIVVAIINGN